MKKLLLSAAALTVGAGLMVANAQTLPSITSLLQDASFGYDQQNRVIVDSITSTEITLISPIIMYYNNDAVMFYRLTYSPYMVEQLSNNATLGMSDQVKSKENTLQNGTDRMVMTLGVEDGLDVNRNYYAFVTPIDIYDDIGNSSEQICFNLAQERYDIGDNCLVFEMAPVAHGGEVEQVVEHGAPSTADMALANITHTIAGDVITLKWTAIDGVDKIDLFVFNIESEGYSRVGEVRISDEEYKYTMKWDGEHIFRFNPLNGAKEVVYTVNAMKSAEPQPEQPKPVIPVPPATGPIENTLAILGMSGLIYFVYRKYRLKADR
jgi:hypothetical protein